MTGAQRMPLDDHVADARALLAGARRAEVVRLGAEAVGRVARRALRARVDVPGFDNSQMDGFAVAAEDLAAGSPTVLPLGPVIAAGDAPSTLRAGVARAIMTGAPLPEGADLVIPVEESAAGTFHGTAAEAGQVTLSPLDTRAGRFVRRRGSDTRSGDTVVREGQVLTPARIAHCAAVGLTEAEVEARLRVVVLSTGSEVASGRSGAVRADAASGTAGPGTIHDANGPGLAAALAAAGAEVVHRGAVPDDPDALLAALRELAGTLDADLVVTSGGVSAGAFEVVRGAADADDVDLVFASVAMQPGGPQGIGTLTVAGRRVPWLAFPGNPVSALLSAELIARPALGAPPRTRLHLPVRLEEPVDSPPALEQYRRARLLPSGWVRLVGGASSHLIGGLAAADALVRIPAGTSRIADGDILETLLIPGGDS